MSTPSEFEYTYIEACVRPGCEEARFRATVSARLPRALLDEALERILLWEGYRPTQLEALNSLSRELGISALDCKDESSRFGLGSFKALGGAYAVEVLRRSQASTSLTVACATEGNHGRSVAWGARQAGARCIIFLHENVSQAREDAIAQYGAEIRRVPGNYDDAVLACAKTSEEEGWTIVSDTTWPGYEEIPTYVMAGYGVMVQEVLAQQTQMPTHVFLQAGVGGMAAAIMAAYVHLADGPLPRFITVEPRNAACILHSVKNGGSLTTIRGALETISAGLACGAPSPLALSILEPGLHAAMAIDDGAMIKAMRRLAYPTDNDPAIVAGASGAAGLAGLYMALQDAHLRERLELGSASRVLVFNSEGDTDPQGYRQLLDSAA